MLLVLILSAAKNPLRVSEAVKLQFPWNNEQRPNCLYGKWLLIKD